jgi:hypothetical protein
LSVIAKLASHPAFVVHSISRAQRVLLHDGRRTVSYRGGPMVAWRRPIAARRIIIRTLERGPTARASFDFYLTKPVKGDEFRSSCPEVVTR